MRPVPVTLAILTGIGLIVGGGVFWIQQSISAFYLRKAIGAPRSSLRTIASAQEDFRRQDRDGDGKPGYWRDDIAGLYTLLPRGSTEPVRLIEITVAEADHRPVSDVAPRSPKSGYWFRALLFSGETAPSPDRFAAHAFPAEPAGKPMYILCQDGILWSKAAVAGGVDRFPADPGAEGWRR